MDVNFTLLDIKTDLGRGGRQHGPGAGPDPEATADALDPEQSS